MEHGMLHPDERGSRHARKLVMVQQKGGHLTQRRLPHAHRRLHARVAQLSPHKALHRAQHLVERLPACSKLQENLEQIPSAKTNVTIYTRKNILKKFRFCGRCLPFDLAIRVGTLGFAGARGSSSQGLTIAWRRPYSFKKKYVPPMPSSDAWGSCCARRPPRTAFTMRRTSRLACVLPTTSTCHACPACAALAVYVLQKTLALQAALDKVSVSHTCASLGWKEEAAHTSSSPARPPRWTGLATWPTGSNAADSVQD